MVLVSVTNRPAELSGFGVYYSVDSTPGKTAIGGLKDDNGNAPNYDLFGISLDKSLSGTLSVDVYAHQKSLPCIRFKGRADVALTGAPKQEAQIDLTQVTTAGCDTSFPKGTMPKNPKIWAKQLDDMWIAGDEGRILHWDEHPVENDEKLFPMAMQRITSPPPLCKSAASLMGLGPFQGGRPIGGNSGTTA